MPERPGATAFRAALVFLAALAYFLCFHRYSFFLQLSPVAVALASGLVTATPRPERWRRLTGRPPDANHRRSEEKHQRRSIT